MFEPKKNEGCFKCFEEINPCDWLGVFSVTCVKTKPRIYHLQVGSRPCWKICEEICSAGDSLSWRALARRND